MFKGSIVALVTPFDERGNVDYATLAELIEWHIASSTDSIVLCGSTGEASTLSYEETLKIFEIGVAVSGGRIPIIAGTGSNDTAKAVKLTLDAKNLGVDAALVIVPYYNRPTPEGCFLHFQEVSKVDLPMIVYHHPGRTGIKLTPKALARISELSSVVGIKDGATDLDHTLELLEQTSVPVLCGDDSLLLPMMASGAVGVISIVANIIPRQWKILTTLMENDEVGKGREYFRRYFSLVKSMVLEINPQCVKYALSVMGKCLPEMRLPLIQPQDVVKDQIAAEIAKLMDYSLISER